MVQFFESPWENLEYRTLDIFHAGYKEVWVPPSGRADLGDFSAGYDVYDRFDLGHDAQRTLYGTYDGLRRFNDVAHRAGLLTYADLILNHCGFSDNDTNGFQRAGDYPGFVIAANFAPWGDFHDPGAGGDWEMRLAGLIDIAQEQNLQYIRHPVEAGDSRNIPAGTVPLFGRLADVPDPDNRRFYPDLQGDFIEFENPETGRQVRKYRFNLDDPMAGDPVMENATGLLLRYTQWMNEVVAFDGFRVDAMKHIPQWYFNDFHDDAACRNGRVMLNGERLNPFSFGEVFDGNAGVLLSYVRKNEVSNRDVLDFSLFFALGSNLSSNGFANDWRNVVNANLDRIDNGFVDASAGVRFIQSHDSFGPHLDNVALTYSLLLPGRSVVYFNARQFSSDREFPKAGRGDALGGIYGETARTLVSIANTHGRGEYFERYLAKELLVYEREANLLVALSNRLDAGYDTVTVQTAFQPGAYLVELTGNSQNVTIDPEGRVPRLVKVNGQRKATLTIPRNASSRGVHKSGYVVYGPIMPQGSLTLTNVAQTLPPDEFFNRGDYENGNHRLHSIDVIRSPSFKVKLQTSKIRLGSLGREREAEGDNAIFRVNEGVDMTGGGFASVDPADDVAYAFQQFVEKRSPLWDGGDGQFVQTVDARKLVEGMNYLTVRAFRRREPTDGSAIYNDFKRGIYIDLILAPVAMTSPAASSPIEGRLPVVDGDHATFEFASLDGTAKRILVRFETSEAGAAASAGEGGAIPAQRVDRRRFRVERSGLAHGVVRVKVEAHEAVVGGRPSLAAFPVIVRRFEVGDLDRDGVVSEADGRWFATLDGLTLADAGYDPSADFDENGAIDFEDQRLFAARLWGGVMQSLAVAGSPR